MRRRRAPCPRRWRAYVRVGIVWGRMSSPWLALAVLWGLRRVGSVRSYTEDDDAGVSWEEDWHRLQAGWLAGWLPARDGASLKLLPVVSTEASTQLQLWGVLQKEEATCGPVPSQRPAPSSVRRLAGHTRQQDNGPSCGYTRATQPGNCRHTRQTVIKTDALWWWWWRPAVARVAGRTAGPRTHTREQEIAEHTQACLLVSRAKAPSPKTPTRTEEP